MAENVKKQRKKDDGLWIPNQIINIRRNELKELGKMVFAHIYSFRNKGCWQSNKTIANIFQVTERAITKVISDMKKADLVYIKKPKSYYRTIWAKNHPDVIEAVRAWHASGKGRKNLLTELAENGKVTTQNPVSGLSEKLLTTNKETNKETYKKTNAADLPLPAGGQSSQQLKDRQKQNVADIGKFASGFGKPKKTTLSPAEIEQRKQAALNQLKK